MVKKWGFCGYLTCCYKSIVLGDSLYMVVYIKEDFIKVKQPFGKTYWKKEKPQWLSSKESTCNARDACRCVFNPLVGKIPWRRKCNPFQYSCLETPMDRRVLWATVPSYSPWGHKESEQLSDSHTHYGTARSRIGWIHRCRTLGREEACIHSMQILTSLEGQYH